MPALRFRDYICSGLSKKDEDQLARTSSAYRQLEFQQALSEDCNSDEFQQPRK